MTIEEIKINNLYNKTFYFNGDANLSLICYKTEKNPYFSNPDAENQKLSDKWIEKITNYKGIKVVRSKLCDLTNSGFTFNGKIYAGYNSSERLIKHESGEFVKQNLVEQGE